MKLVISAIFLMVSFTSSCQSNSLSFSENYNEAYFDINKEKFCVMKFSIKNESTEDMVLWVSKRENSDFKKYLLGNQGDFNLLSLISEEILMPDNHVIFRSFFKILGMEEEFSFSILIRNPNKDRVEFSKEFIRNYFKHESIKILNSLITKKQYMKSSYRENEIILPYNCISDN